jgi:uncharacterized protein (DUF2267 family)
MQKYGLSKKKGGFMILNFESYSQKATEFVREIATELGNPEDTEHAGRVIQAVFHSIRDIITPEESLHLISQLPMYIKAVYVDKWKISAQQGNIRSLEEYLTDLREKAGRTAERDFGNDETAMQKVEAIFNVLKRHVSEGEIEDIKAQLPQPLAELWEG